MRRIALPLFSLLTFTPCTQSALIASQSPTGSLLGSSFGVPGNQSFDYVIVGGGTAGLVLANRLSENSDLSIAVIEAGGFYEIDNGNISQIPFFAAFGTDKTTENYNPLVDWGFVTVPQEVNHIFFGDSDHYPCFLESTVCIQELIINRVSTMRLSIMLVANALAEALPETSWCISVAARSHMICGPTLSETPVTSGTHSCHILRRV